MKYINAIEEIVKLQGFEIDELKAQIEYLESGSKSEGNLKMIAELKAELAEAESDYENAVSYFESQKKYAA